MTDKKKKGSIVFIDLDNLFHHYYFENHKLQVCEEDIAFIENLCEKFENYRVANNLDEVVVSFTTCDSLNGQTGFYAFNNLFASLKNNENIRVGSCFGGFQYGVILNDNYKLYLFFERQSTFSLNDIFKLSRTYPYEYANENYLRSIIAIAESSTKTDSEYTHLLIQERCDENAIEHLINIHNRHESKNAIEENQEKVLSTFDEMLKYEKTSSNDSKKFIKRW